MVKAYTQQATGLSFWATVVPGTPHCGIDQSKLTCKVSVSIEYPDGFKALDGNGFLLDNTWFRDYFKTLNGIRVNVSCEQLAQDICTQICRAIGTRRATVHLTLSPFDGVSIQASMDHNIAASMRQDAYAGAFGDYPEAVR